MKPNWFFNVTFMIVILAANSYAKECVLSSAGPAPIDMGVMKDRELIPSYSYKCNDEGVQDSAGSSICLQMAYCPHGGNKCYPSAVQGSVFRMSSTGEILNRYPINVDDAGEAKKGKPLLGVKDVDITNAFCPQTNIVNAKAVRRFQCLCNKKLCKESEPLDLYTYASFPNLSNKSNEELLENSLVNGKAEYDRTGRYVRAYFHFNKNQTDRLNQILNGKSPYRTCKEHYVDTSRVNVFGYGFLSVREKKGLLCSNTTSEDFVLLPQFSGAVEKELTPGGENIEGKSDDVGLSTFQMIQQARKSLGGCFPNPDSIVVPDQKSLTRDQQYIGPTRTTR